ncbi:MAG: Holliday junction resolvase RecU [Limosilactobacillus gorillae]|jgi:recombination protein U|uniref:Holliday junction resolvase RecU n=1 Tax=Limosilactobacillus gorillae TaxID=1450649 RepID=UPI000A64BDF7|nr:Holliday junction resolvase RecU [Limosilactobacillus gorillae]MDO4855422.1 Holliday junction resolvase RecU [Limosilactobacillus gorillae]
MMIRYPNGQEPPQAGRVGQPITAPHSSSFAKRGMSLEKEINEANRYYLATKQAVIYKKPTPIQLVKVDYPKRSAAVVKEAYFKRPSTTDYNGVYRGFYIDFDAKETRGKLSFPLKNFHQHQVDHFRRCLAQGGICFAFIRFTTLDLTYLLPASDLIEFWDHQAQGGRKSIPLTTIKKRGYAVKNGLVPRLNYLSAVDQLIAANQAKGADHE